MADPLIDRPDLRVARIAPTAQLLLHGEPGRVAELSAMAGLALGEKMLRSTASGDWHALHRSPDEWLLIGPPSAATDVLKRFDANTVPAFSLVDISERSLGFEIEGGGAVDLLNVGCPLDLSPSAFPTGSCTRTLFGKVAIMLWRMPGSEVFRMHYGRSFDNYVTAYLITAAQDVRLPAALR